MNLVEELAYAMSSPALIAAFDGGMPCAERTMQELQDKFDEELSIYCNETDYHMSDKQREEIGDDFIEKAEDKVIKEGFNIELISDPVKTIYLKE